MQLPLTVIIADDNEMYRAGLSAAIEQLPGAQIAGIASDKEQLLQKIEEHRPQIVLMDAQLPLHNALDACRHICRSYPSTTVIVTSHNCSKWLRDELLQASAWAVLF